MKLSEFPYVVLRLSCKSCDRNGAYRITRLAVRFGAEASVYDVVFPGLTADCPYRGRETRRTRGYNCIAKFIDLEPPRLPADMPAEPLRVVQGGKS